MGWFERLFGRGATAAFPRPPADWSDERGWDTFHAASLPRGRHSPIDLGLQYVASFRKEGFRRIWFAGAGTSAGPRAFAELAFDVVATDFSSIAIAKQTELAGAPLDADLAAFGDAPMHAPTAMQVLTHDFRKPFDVDVAPFDVVLNRRAFQGLGATDRANTARVHHDALRPGGWAMFETMNVAVEFRDALEDSLLGAGQARLDALTAEFAERAKREAEQSAVTAHHVRTAHVIYSTG